MGKIPGTIYHLLVTASTVQQICCVSLMLVAITLWRLHHKWRDLIFVAYPTGLVLNEDGEPNIDTRSDGISRNPVEVHIPFDKDAAMKIFSDKEDYQLSWAVNYLEENV